MKLERGVEKVSILNTARENMLSVTTEAWQFKNTYILSNVNNDSSHLLTNLAISKNIDSSSL